MAPAEEEVEMELDDSLHPGWDRMYATGASAVSIAELSGAHLATVKRHLERRRVVNPDLAVQHNAARKKPSDQWRRRVFEFRDFIATHGRYPTLHGTQDDERQLYAWLAAQRHALVAQTLSWEQAREMGVLGDWVTTGRERAEDARWRERLGEVVEFVAEYGRLPRHRTAKAEEVEHVLGIWLQTQGIDIYHGRIRPWKLEAIREVLPGWRKGRNGE